MFDQDKDSSTRDVVFCSWVSDMVITMYDDSYKVYGFIPDCTVDVPKLSLRGVYISGFVAELNSVATQRERDTLEVNLKIFLSPRNLYC